MNKLVVLAVGGVIVVGAGAAFAVTRHNNNASVTNNATGQTQEVKTGQDALVAVDACDVLTQAVATQILGSGAIKRDVSAGNASTNDASVSNCIYSVEIQPGALKANNTKGVSILVRSGKSQLGADSNKAQFGTAKPAGVQDVSGLGDAAYFNPKFGQLNVLKGGNWYIVTSYSGRVTSATLASDTALAQLLSFK